MGIFGLFSKEKKEKLDSGLSKTKDSIFSKLAKTVVGKSKGDDEVLDDVWNLIKHWKFSQITEFYLQRILENDKKIKAFEVIYPDAAMKSAKAADSQIAEGNWLGPFHGIPFVLKDICDLEGHITTCGSELYKNRVSISTASIASRLLSAGGILLGKSKTVEFAFGGWGTNQRMGTPMNPWDEKNHRICGGSSSGSAAALAANMAVCAIGTDTGGSIRFPSACCGIVGIKPTYSRVSRYGGFVLADSSYYYGILPPVVPLLRNTDVLHPHTLRARR